MVYADIFKNIALITLKAPLLRSANHSRANVYYKMRGDKIDFDMCLLKLRRMLQRMRTSVIRAISDLRTTTSDYDLFMICRVFTRFAFTFIYIFHILYFCCK